MATTRLNLVQIASDYKRVTEASCLQRNAMRVKACSSSDGLKGHELRVCTNRTCRRSGSLKILEILRSLASPDVTVQSCGCLGRCGSGPNLVILPAQLFISHCNTPEHASRLLALQCGLSNPENNLKALSLKEQGSKSFESGDFTGAETLFSQAIELQPSGGLHFLYLNRSATRLANNDLVGALEDANHAATLAPQWHMAYFQQGEVYMRTKDYHTAEDSFTKAILLEPSLRRSKTYQLYIQELQNMSQTNADVQM